MNEEVSVTKPDTEAALYVGAITTAIVYLLPYVNDFIITPYVVGTLVAVWYAVKRRGQILALKEGAKLGFLSTFFGGIASAIIFDIIWQFFDFQLWQKQNSEFMVTIFSAFASPAMIDTMKIGMAQNATKPFSWYIIIFQLIGGLIFSGIFGSLFGLLGVKIFQGRAVG
jgi:hypothetical protein